MEKEPKTFEITVSLNKDEMRAIAEEVFEVINPGPDSLPITIAALSIYMADYASKELKGEPGEALEMFSMGFAAGYNFHAHSSILRKHLLRKAMEDAKSGAAITELLNMCDETTKDDLAKLD